MRVRLLTLGISISPAVSSTRSPFWRTKFTSERSPFSFIFPRFIYFAPRPRPPIFELGINFSEISELAVCENFYGSMWNSDAQRTRY